VVTESQSKTTSQILQRARDTLSTAKLGLRALKAGEPEARVAGLRNLVVFGRAVTNVLQNLRSTEATFNAWYNKYEAEMRADPLMKYFYDLRSRILKQGDLPVHSSVQLSGDPMAAVRHAGPAPPGAKGFFIGDTIGGSGWEIQLPDGSTEKFYVTLPSQIPGLDTRVQIHLSDVPSQFRDRPVADLAEEYLGYLDRMVDDASTQFARSSHAELGR
jgi:hypothetical protein